MISWEDRGEPQDSPERGVAEHVSRYLATDGADGHLEGGMTNLLLTTVGRRTGTLRRTGLFYGEDNGRLVLVASHFAGGPIRPAWYLNVVRHPEALVQIRGERFTALARTTEGAERARLWRMMTTRFPPYERFQARTGHRIPVVVLERAPR